jgi:uncharacterized protein
MMMPKHLTAAILAMLFSACTSAPPVQFYVLEPISQSAPSPTKTFKQRTIGIGPVSIPALLEHKKIVTRLSDNTVQIAAFEQWASPLQDNLLQALTRNLSSLQPGNIFRAYPWSAHGTVDLQIIVDIIRFDTTPGESANLEANWTIKNETTLNILKSGHSLIQRPLPDSSYPGAVRALSKILGELSQELSLALIKLETQP